MKIDQYLKEELTNDKTADAVESNYRGLMEVEGIERDPMQEQYIKLNKLERLMRPTKPELVACAWNGNLDLAVVCPNCKQLFEVGLDHYKHCPSCGQALDWSEVEE